MGFDRGQETLNDRDVKAPPHTAWTVSAGLLLSLLCFPAGSPLLAQEPPAESTPAPETETETETDEEEDAGESEKQATLKVECDLDCTVTVGLQPAREVKADEVLSIEIEPGAVRVKAFVTGIFEASTFEDVTAEAGQRVRVRLKMDKALAELRKVEARDRTYRDPDTRLMWPNRDNGTDLEWQEAIDYCEGLQHGAWEDWRLPTLAELEDIEAMWSLRPYKTADPISLTSCCTWSSDRIDEENAWNFNYRFRRPFRGHVSYSLSLRALCVRDGSDEIPENTRKNRRLAKREAKERQREKRLRQAEREAAKAAAAEGENEEDGSGEGSSPDLPPQSTPRVATGPRFTIR